MSGSKPEATRLRVGPGRLSFPNLIEPKETARGDRFGTTLLLPPDYDTRFITEACLDLCKATWGNNPKSWPANARKPEAVVRDAGEKQHLAGYLPGWRFISMISSEQPGIVGFDPSQVITNPKEVYAGRWAKISCRPFVYQMREGVGVSLGLNNVQLLKHDSAFGRTAPTQDFDVESEEMADGF